MKILANTLIKCLVLAISLIALSAETNDHVNLKKTLVDKDSFNISSDSQPTTKSSPSN